MNNRRDALLLLKKLREHLQNNHGVKEGNFYQALISLDRGIEELESRRARDRISANKILNLIVTLAKALPSIVNLINNRWK